MEQLPLFRAEHVSPRVRWEQLFQHLPRLPAEGRVGQRGPGRRPIDPNVVLRALIYRALRRLATLSHLVFALGENFSVAEAIGWDPMRAPPPVERFSKWLRATDNAHLQTVRVALLEQLDLAGAVEGKIVALDSCAIPVAVRENNWKTPVHDRFNKDRPPVADPQARLGVVRQFFGSAPHRVRFFWGYRNHVLVDVETELPLWEETHPADVKEAARAISLLTSARQRLALVIEAVTGDSTYDVERILRFVIEDFKARPVIAANPPFERAVGFRVVHSQVFCPADLPMVHKGRLHHRRTGIAYRQYCCPLHYNRQLQQQYLLCPAGHPKYSSQKGCYHLVRMTPSVRSQISYDSQAFHRLYRRRTSVERLFSRLLAITMQSPTVYGLNAIRNHCTVAHIAVLLVALTAHRQAHLDKLAFVRTYVPNFLTTP